MTSLRVHLERRLTIARPAEEVWQRVFASPGAELFQLNLFHRRAELPDDAIVPGSKVLIEHGLGWRLEMRTARITTLEPYTIAWSEVRRGGRDYFPHSQRFRLLPDENGSGCTLLNSLRGSFPVPGARWWLWSWYRHLLPLILDRENQLLLRLATR